MNVSTEATSVPGHPGADVPPPDAPVTRGYRRWPWWLLGLGCLAVAGGLLAAFTVHLPYYEFRPGSARPTAGLVVADGVDTYPPASDIAFTTVSLRHSTLASRVQAWFDEDIEVVDEEVVLGDRSPSENRQFNLQLMDTSKQDAIRVALLALGHEVPVAIDGVVVVQLVEGSAAQELLSVGDTIVSVDGQELTELDQISAIMAGKVPGDTVQLVVEPPDRQEQRTVEITLSPAPDDPGRGIIGVSLQPRDPQYQFPFDIDIDSGRVGGPSAGLAFTLGVIDVLTPGELTGGERVAATGTIDSAGNVGPVGGVAQKTAVVVDEGYDVFLVPSSELEAAAERAGDRVQVIPVDTLQEALDALESLGGSGLAELAIPTG
jgi:PDZ domain-containing protein